MQFTRVHMLLAGIVLTAAASPALAYETRHRVVERIGNVDVPLGDAVYFTPGTTHRLRMQFGVFDDAISPAPAGGFAAWNRGEVHTSGNGVWSRTPGRLGAFASPPQPTANGFPVADPFTDLEFIDCALLFQALPWFCGPDGQPGPVPQPTIRGLNEFVSVFEVTVAIPLIATPQIEYTFEGTWFAVAEWRFDLALSTLPDCETGEIGVAWHNPLTRGNTGAFSRTLTINTIPAPAAGALFTLAGLALARRRRA